MITQQAKLKQQAYASNLKSRALSILIYLIDRSNKELTCYPAIPTMAKELHIGTSTVKRALHELMEAGFIQKEARFREKNRGQTSNLYILMFHEETPTPKTDNSLVCEDHIDVPTEKTSDTGEVTHITFATLRAEKQKQKTDEAAPKADIIPEKATVRPYQPKHLPVQTAPHWLHPSGFLFLQIKEKAGQFLPCKFSFCSWTGAGFNLQPP